VVVIGGMDVAVVAGGGFEVVAVGLLVTGGLPPVLSNCHQLKLKREPLPPVKRKKRSRFPVAPLTVQVTVVHIDHPPVPGTLQVPMSVPEVLPRRSSILPPLVPEETRALKDLAPVPKATPLTLM
jgi:hypothetical protein